jgi:threonine/homoserine/homoserine lactone efflux protein
LFDVELVHVLAFAAVAGLLVMSPGPNGVLIAKTVPTSGRAAGFANVAGFVGAFYLHGALSIFGISILLVRSAEAFFVVKALGAAYLCWIGLKALRDAWRGVESVARVAPARRRRNLTKAGVEGFLTNALNPKVSMFYLAAFPQFMPLGEGAVRGAFVLVTVHALLNLVWFSAMVLLFGRLMRAARSGRFQRWLKAVTGVIFVGFGARLAALSP